MSRRMELIVELVKKQKKIPLLELAKIIGLTPRYLHREVLPYIQGIKVVKEDNTYYVVWVGEQ